MFLRKMRRRKDGKVHTYWALVESVRTVKGPRQRVVAHLGELSPGRRVGFQRLGQELEGRDGAGQLVLYGDNPKPALVNKVVFDRWFIGFAQNEIETKH